MFVARFSEEYLGKAARLKERGPRRSKIFGVEVRPESRKLSGYGEDVFP